MIFEILEFISNFWILQIGIKAQLERISLISMSYKVKFVTQELFLKEFFC